jgi:hypothetical protein
VQLSYNSHHNDSSNGHSQQQTSLKEDHAPLTSNFKLKNKASKTNPNEKSRWEKTLTEEDVRKEYQEILNRRREAKDKDEKVLNVLPLADKTFATKEERILLRWESRENDWRHLTSALANILSRKYDECVMMKCEENRSLVEIKETLEILKNGDQRYGKDFWIKFLRKFPNEEKILFDKEKICLENIPEKNSLLNRPNSAIATIRKPYLVFNKKRPKSSVRTQQEYEKIFKENEEKLEDLRKASGNLENFEV